MIPRSLFTLLLTFAVAVAGYCQPSNNECSGASSLLVLSSSAACSANGIQLNVHTDGTTRSSIETQAVGYGEFDRFYTWTATTRGLQPNFSFGAGIRASVYENLGSASNPVCGDYINSCIYGSPISLSGWEIGDNLIVQVEWDRAIDAQFSFCFSESVLALPSNDQCISSIELTCQSQWQSFELAGSTGGISTTCNVTRPLWFKIDNPERSLNLEIRSSDFWVQYEIFTGSDCGNLTSLLCTDAASIELPPNDQSLYIAVGTNTNAGGPNLSFEIRATNCRGRQLVESGPGVTCSEAVQINCLGLDYSWDRRWRPIYIGPDFPPNYVNWLTLEGTGQELGIESDPYVVIYEGNDCGGLTKIEALDIPSNTEYFFNTTAGKTYYFQCIERTSIFTDNFGRLTEISINCRHPPSNNLCTNAEQILCGTRLIGSTKDSRISGDPVQQGQLRTVYYHFTGNGQKYRLFLTSATPLASRVFAHIFSDSCGGSSLNYTYTGIASQSNEFVWQAVTTPGQEYYVAIGLAIPNGSQGVPDLDNFEIWLECENDSPPVNEEQVGATAIACGESISVPTFGDPSIGGTSGNCLTASPTLWYKYESDGSSIDIKTRAVPGGTSSRWKEINVCILKDVGGQLTYLDSEYDHYLDTDYDNLISLASEAGVTYYFVFALELTPGPVPLDYGFEFSLDCLPPLANDFCFGAIEVLVQQPGAPRVTVTTELDNAYPSGIPNCTDGDLNKDVWYKFVAPISGVVVPNVRNLELYLSCSDQQPVQCDQDLPSKLGGLTPGQTYYLRKEVPFFGGQHQIYLTAGLTPPENDSCGGALPMILDGNATNWPENQFSNTVFLNYEANINQSLEFNNGAWYSFTAPPTGVVSVEYDLSSNAQRAAGYSVFYGTCDSMVEISTQAQYVQHELHGLIPGRDHFLVAHESTFSQGSANKDVSINTEQKIGDGPDMPQPVFLSFNNLSCSSFNYASQFTPAAQPDLQCDNTNANAYDRWKFVRLEAVMPYSSILIEFSPTVLGVPPMAEIEITATRIGASEPEFCFGPFSISENEFEIAAEDLTLYEGYDIGVKFSGIEPGLPDGNIEVDICLRGEHHLIQGIAPVTSQCQETIRYRDSYGGYYYFSPDAVDVAHCIDATNPAGSIEYVRAQSPLPNGEIVLPRSFTFVPEQAGEEMDGRYRLYFPPTEIDQLLALDPTLNSIRDIKILIDPTGTCESPGSSYVVIPAAAAGFTGFYYFVEIDLDLVPRSQGGVYLRNGFTMLASSAAITSPIVEVKNQPIKMFPQPATEYVNFDLTGLPASSTTGNIYDLTSRLVKSVLLNSGEISQFYVGDLSPGTYSVCFSIDGRLYEQRLAVQ
ncbi:MAG: hypothetical protein AB8F78_05645 [Saprospiraceae bacterium]